MKSPASLEILVDALRCLPGVGPKSAQRMAFHLLQHDREGAVSLSRALSHAVERIGHCERCHTFSEEVVCTTCLDPARDASRLCVVETPADQSALERTAAYKGLYFVLMGHISPLDGVGPGDLNLRSLLDRLRGNRASLLYLVLATLALVTQAGTLWIEQRYPPEGEIVRIDGGEIPGLAGEFSFMRHVPQSVWDRDEGRLNQRKRGEPVPL